MPDLSQRCQLSTTMEKLEWGTISGQDDAFKYQYVQ